MAVDFGNFEVGTGTWIDRVLVSCKQFLAANRVYSQDAIWTYVGRPDDLMDHPLRDSFLVVSPASASMNQAIVSGSGNSAPWVDFQVAITQYERLWKDRAQQDTARIEDANRGLAEKVRGVFKFLQMWIGQTVATTSAAFLEMVATTNAQPARLAPGGIRFNARKIPLGWASVDSTWEIPFQADLS